MTTNHNYSTPEQGATDWHVPLNENFRRLDADVEIRDEEGALDSYDPRDGAKFLATDTGNVFVGDGSSWSQLGSLSGGGGSGGTTAVSAADYAGSDLSARVENALADLPSGAGTVVIPPKADGNYWLWDSTLTIRPTEYDGIELRALGGTRIRCTQSGYAITIHSDDPGLQASLGKFVNINGGAWEGLGGSSDQDGWLQIIDAYYTDISPMVVRAFENGAGTAACISIENHETFAEASHIYSTILRDSNVGIDFRGASVTGGDGTDSFADTRISDVTCSSITDYGLKLQGSMDGALVDNYAFFPGGEGASAVLMNGYCEQCQFTNPRIDNPGHRDGITGFEQGPNFWGTGPLITQPYFVQTIDTAIDASAPVYQIDASEGTFNVRANGEKIASIDPNGTLRLAGDVREGEL